AVPDWLQDLIETGALGEKVKHGVYQKIKGEIHVLDRATKNYRLSAAQVDEDLKRLLKYSSPMEKFAALRNSHEPQAQFLWSIFRDLFHYCAVQLGSIADNARDLDLAVRWGFGWNQGPFEIWQAAGWRQIAHWIQEDIAAGKCMSQAPLPPWVMTIADSESPGVHSSQGSFAPASGKPHGRSKLPVYQRQLFPDRLSGESATYGETIFETDAVRLWHTGDKIAILSFKSKMHTVGLDVLEGIQQAIKEAEQNWRALVIWQTEPPFSAGANLQKATEKPKADAQQSREPAAPPAPPKPPTAFQSFLKKLRKSTQETVLHVARELDLADVLMAKKLAEVESMIKQFQQTSQKLRYSMIPTVAAVDGLALGGGCEFVMHCDRAVATLESYIGLVETGVGLLPAGGGCKEFAMRAAQNAKDGDPFPQLKHYFQTVAMAELAKSAEQAKELGYLRRADTVVMHRFELLHVAKAQALALAEAGYRPPLRAREIPVAGNTGIATIQSQLVNMREGGFISEHDNLIANKVAHVMCGGD
ncbi:MAG: enoyl-CoA hydratase/isomerase family protein, partial [Betaproteobacteria bacterium]|nr:enoyl-CoA hydratase/isomerase family protein [Betaproteobacteria bacterium]